MTPEEYIYNNINTVGFSHGIPAPQELLESGKIEEIPGSAVGLNFENNTFYVLTGNPMGFFFVLTEKRPHRVYGEAYSQCAYKLMSLVEINQFYSRPLVDNIN